MFGSAPETSTTVLVKGVMLRGKAAGRKNRAGSKQLRPVSSIKSVDRSSADDDVIKTGGKKVQRMRDDLVVDPFGSKRMKGTVYLFRIECVFKLFYINFFHCSSVFFLLLLIFSYQMCFEFYSWVLKSKKEAAVFF